MPCLERDHGKPKRVPGWHQSHCVTKAPDALSDASSTSTPRSSSGAGTCGPAGRAQRQSAPSPQALPLHRCAPATGACAPTRRSTRATRWRPLLRRSARPAPPAARTACWWRPRALTARPWRRRRTPWWGPSGGLPVISHLPACCVETSGRTPERDLVPSSLCSSTLLMCE